MSTPNPWNNTEAKKARTGKYPEASSKASNGDQDVYLTWIRECDARKSHALLIQNKKVNDLLKIRALMFRGQLEEAEAIIQKLDLAPSSPEEKMESSLEQARLAAFRGDWLLAQTICEKALGSGTLESLSYLSSLQVHALSSFERGELSSAAKSLDAAESLSTIYPFSISTLYANVLRARLIARDQSVRSGIQAIHELWKKFRTTGQTPTADEVHAILFGTIDILKFGEMMGASVKSLGTLMLVSFQMTETMGEQLYSALAALDASVCGPRENRGWFLERLKQSRGEFKRIDSLAQEVFDGKEPTSSSAAVLKNLYHADRETADSIPPSEQPRAMTHIVFNEQEWVFQLQPWKAVDLRAHPQILTAFQALSKGSLSKADFFARVWGNARYTSRLHDSSIWYVLNRIKKLTGASYQTRNGFIQANDGVVSL
jgi:hypothetical protein